MTRFVILGAFALAAGCGTKASTDTADTDTQINDCGSTEIPYDGKDNDCDPNTPDDDLDGDGYAEATDCDDADAAVHPGATETAYNGKDDDCDATTLDDDLDGDGYAQADDCDDTDAAVNPGATELCNGKDDDCDGTIDGPASADATVWRADVDGDGYGEPTSGLSACDQPSGYVAENGDCDDANPDINPGAAETCNGIDDNCDGTVDGADSVDATAWTVDADGDGYGDATAPSVYACSAPTGDVANATDCNDADAKVSPGAREVCIDAVDNDCDGDVDETPCSGTSGSAGGGYGGHRIDNGGDYYYALYNDRGFGILGSKSWYGSKDSSGTPEGVTWDSDGVTFYYNDLSGNVFSQTAPFGDTSTLVGTFSVGEIGGGVVLDGYYYVGDSASADIWQMDVTTGKYAVYAKFSGDSSCKPYFGNSAMSIDSDGTVYAASSCGIVAYTSGGGSTLINAYTGLISAVAMDADNELYSLDSKGRIVHFDKLTGDELGHVTIGSAPSTTWTLAVDGDGNFVTNYWGTQAVYSSADGSTVETWDASSYYPGSSGYYWYVTF